MAASWDEFIKASLEFSGFEDISQIPQLSQGAQMLLSGMLIMADWLASNQSYFPYIAADSSGDCGVYPKRVSDGWKKIGLTRPWHAQCFNIDSVGFKERFGFEPNSFQKDVAGAAAGAADMGLLVLEAQMGIGKTEAALAAAEILAANKGCGGIFSGCRPRPRPTAFSLGCCPGADYHQGRRGPWDTPGAWRSWLE